MDLPDRPAEAQPLREPLADLGDAAVANPILRALLDRMRDRSDFPAMSAQIVKVLRIASNENESLNSLTSSILEDVALTHKLLRLVNSARYAHLGGEISTVSRAVSLIGFSEVRCVAMSLVMLEHMHDKVHAEQLKDEFLRAMFAGTLAADLCLSAAEHEEAFLGTVFQNLGRLLAEFYFPAEATRVRAALAEGRQNEEQASLRALGLSYEALGLGVAQLWHLPQHMQRLMQHKQGQPPSRQPVDATERLRWIGAAAHEFADAFMRHERQAWPAELERLGARYAPCLGHDRARLGQLAMQARTKLAAMVQALDLTVARESLAARLIDMPEPSAEQKDGLGAYALEPDEGADRDAPQAVETPMALLAKGVQDVTQAMVEGLALNDVLRMVLETMYRALGMQRVVLCLKDAAGEQLSGRLGLGHEASRVARLFRVPLQSSELLFSAVCLKGLDTHIRDASAANVASRLPDWYRRDVHAPAFLLLPMHFKGSPFGLIYADRATVDAAGLQEQELALLRTLRNQAVMAFRQARS